MSVLTATVAITPPAYGFMRSWRSLGATGAWLPVNESRSLDESVAEIPMTSLKESARKAFLEEPPFPDSVFEEFSEGFIKAFYDYLLSLGYLDTDMCVREMMRFLRGENDAT